MKAKIFITIISLFVLCSWTSPSGPEFLYLNAAQLKPLGIELNENGVFYKNCNPNWKQDHSKYACMSFYFANDNYVTTTHYNESEKIVAKNINERIIHKMTGTNNDFYPVLIGNTDGEMSLDKDLPANTKLIPIAICMSETKLSARKDTIVVWFKPSEAMRKALPANVVMEDWMKTPVVKSK